MLPMPMREIIKSFSTIDNVIDFINNKKYEDVWIIGGESIYKSFLELNLISELQQPLFLMLLYDE